ncbi:MAG TPA: hypothetical protein DCY35_07930, partial [Prolixibacteraceae bacterium]|nr:hypothetical protein [Prolixibacteraceae bacterium]
MVAGNAQRLSKLARELNVGIQTMVDFLHKKGIEIDHNPNTKIAEDICHLLEKEFKSDVSLKRESEQITLRQQRIRKEVITLDDIPRKEDEDEDFDDDFLGVDELKRTASAATSHKAPEKPKSEEPAKEEVRESLIKPFKIVDKIDINDLPGHKKKPAEKPVTEKPQPKAEPAAAVDEPKPAEIKEEITKTVVPAETPTSEPMVAEEKKEQIQEPKKEQAAPVVTEVVQEHIKTEIPKVDEPKVIGKIDLGQLNTKTRPAKKTREERDTERKLRKTKDREPRASENAETDRTVTESTQAPA